MGDVPPAHRGCAHHERAPVGGAHLHPVPAYPRPRVQHGPHVDVRRLHAQVSASGGGKTRTCNHSGTKIVESKSTFTAISVPSFMFVFLPRARQCASLELSRKPRAAHNLLIRKLFSWIGGPFALIILKSRAMLCVTGSHTGPSCTASSVCTTRSPATSSSTRRSSGSRANSPTCTQNTCCLSRAGSWGCRASAECTALGKCQAVQKLLTSFPTLADKKGNTDKILVSEHSSYKFL